MIISFGNRTTSDLYHGVSNSRARKLPSQAMESMIYKMDIINSAQSLEDLRFPPGNRLEALRGDLSGYYSIRINKQWRIIFKWEESNAYEVQIIDYH